MEYDVVNDAAGSVRNIEMVYVEGGTFTMGASVSDSMARVDERPARRVTLSGYRIGRYAVTQGLWVEIMGSNPSRWKDVSLPVC
ncbi:MAG: SUMF1/EgtB/PvdO family nonheme iron enzyme, partial [Alistipes sp.]|nr:SUMF1/EgtB/PvdO family nonheme iron enzyme [Alistipes sp.]